MKITTEIEPVDQLERLGGLGFIFQYLVVHKTGRDVDGRLDMPDLFADPDFQQGERLLRILVEIIIALESPVVTE
jgi:hypothetical protein